MKRLIVSILTTWAIVLGMVAATSVSAQVSAQSSAVSNDVLWERANAAYQAGDFASAEALYDSIELSGMASAKLYYNKGNALFKMGKTGESILYYAKAQRLAPADNDIAHNLAIASARTRNRIEPVPEFFLKRWIRGGGSVMSGNSWAVTSLILFALVLTGGVLFFLPLGRRMRKIGFYGGLATLVLLIFAFSFAQGAYREAKNPTEGVVTSAQAAVKSSPDNSGTDLFLLYEGDRVTVRDRLGEWSEIVVANGNRGWVRTSTVSMVD